MFLWVAQHGGAGTVHVAGAGAFAFPRLGHVGDLLQQPAYASSTAMPMSEAVPSMNAYLHCASEQYTRGGNSPR